MAVCLFGGITQTLPEHVTDQVMKGQQPLSPSIRFYSGGVRESKENSNLFCTFHLTVADDKQHPRISNWRLVLSNYLIKDSRISLPNVSSQDCTAMGWIAWTRVAPHGDNSRGRRSITGGHKTPNKPSSFCLWPEDKVQLKTIEMPSNFFLTASSPLLMLSCLRKNTGKEY